VDEVVAAPRARLDVAADSRALSARLAGELDLASLPDIRTGLDNLLSRPSQPLQIDLTDLTFLDSSGVAVLIRLANHFVPVQTVQATAAVRRVLDVLGLADWLGLERA
jgi:anti-sigma B factor antagonist